MELVKADLAELINQMAIRYNEEVTEFDDLVQALEDSRVESMGLARQLKLLNEGAEQIQKNAQKHMDMLTQALREKDQMADKLDLVQTNLKLYKELGTPKKIREQIKGYKTKAAESLKTIASAKTTVKGYRKEIDQLVANNQQLKVNQTENNITSIWSENGQHLMLFPSQLTMAVDGKEEKQMTLLFMDGSGTGKLIGLNEDGEAILCKSPAGGLKPKARTKEVAGEMLRKWKRQGWKLTQSDLQLSEK